MEDPRIRSALDRMKLELVDQLKVHVDLIKQRVIQVTSKGTMLLQVWYQGEDNKGVFAYSYLNPDLSEIQPPKISVLKGLG
jgi:hypothetical protein